MSEGAGAGAARAVPASLHGCARPHIPHADWAYAHAESEDDVLDELEREYLDKPSPRRRGPDNQAIRNKQREAGRMHGRVQRCMVAWLRTLLTHGRMAACMARATPHARVVDRTSEPCAQMLTRPRAWALRGCLCGYWHVPVACTACMHRLNVPAHTPVAFSRGCMHRRLKQACGHRPDVMQVTSQASRRARASRARASSRRVCNAHAGAFFIRQGRAPHALLDVTLAGKAAKHAEAVKKEAKGGKEQRFKARSEARAFKGMTALHPSPNPAVTAADRVEAAACTHVGGLGRA
eukprot:13085-Chlamydomonas_euryale.AAC.3